MSWIVMDYHRWSSYFPPKNTHPQLYRVFPGIAHFQTQRLFGFPASRWIGGQLTGSASQEGSKETKDEKDCGCCFDAMTLRGTFFFFFWDSELEQFTWVCSCWIITWKRWRLTLWDLYEIDVMMFGMTLYWYDTRVYCYDLCCSPIYHLAPVREVVLTSFLQCLVKSPWWLSRKRLRRREKRPPQSRSFSDRDSPWIFHIFVHVYPFGYWVPISMETKQCPKSPVDELMSSGIIQYYTNQHIVTIITSVR